MGARKGLENTLSRLYPNILRRFFQKLGVHSKFVALFHRILDIAFTIEYLRSPDVVSVDIDDVHAEFPITSKADFRRVSLLTGERAVVARLLDNIELDDTVWDVGANVGTHTVFFSKAASQGTVVSFEPHPTNAERLEATVEFNDCGNVQISDVALADETGAVDLHVEGHEAGMGTHSLRENDAATERIEVSVARGDEVASNEFETPTVIKIDVEGAELDVLRGLSGVLSADECQVVMCEFHSEENKHEAITMLEQYGFSIEEVMKRGQTSFLLAVRSNT
jgi:FkbM family methyltransferase